MQDHNLSKETAKENRAPAVEYVHTTNIPDLFRSLKLSLLVSTYQAQRIMVLSPGTEKLSMLMRVLPRPTGLALSANQMAVCSKNQIWIFDTARDIHDTAGNIQPHDLWYVPRRSHVTGDILAHEIAWHKNDLYVVNTRFSCICTLTSEWSFLPIWKPAFISSYAAEDRCHVNGMACDADGPRYVSALGESNVAEGWRETKTTGGVIIDYRSGEVVSRGLCMPHSPRLHGGRLWILESGTGEIQVVDPINGQRTTVVKLPGYLRGLTFYDRFAFVGLCKIREKKTFGGLPIEAQHSELPCAIYVIDLKTGTLEGFIQFNKGIEEIFDILVLPGLTSPQVVGFEEDTIDGLFLFPHA